MKVTRCSPLSGKVNSREIPIKELDFAKWEAGTPIQTAAPYLSADDREFLISGITPEEWEEMFGED